MSIYVIFGSVGNFYIQFLNGLHMCGEVDIGGSDNKTPISRTPKLVKFTLPVREIFGTYGAKGSGEFFTLVEMLLLR
jgi:hypothetical protein